jgi:hypothetical protein
MNGSLERGGGTGGQVVGFKEASPFKRGDSLKWRLREKSISEKFYYALYMPKGNGEYFILKPCWGFLHLIARIGARPGGVQKDTCSKPVATGTGEMFRYP